MGRQYKEVLEKKIGQLGAQNVRAYIMLESFSPEYRRHLLSTLHEMAVAVVDSPADANFIIAANAQPQAVPNCIVANVAHNEMVFVGAISA